ncbi:MAG: methyltransferase domain-containing protein, partial [Deltaproteobacteria bacterium]|nr:methyltransferase domain-containing protein [Deltaproteobacteria bacterium]
MTHKGTPRHELEVDSRYVFLTSLAAERRVLDLGGSGRALLTLAEAGTAELTHCSDDAAAVQAALNDAGVEGVDVRGGAELPLPFEDQAFDLIICHDLGDKLVRDEQWAAELRRVLDPAGYLVLALANPEGKVVSDLTGERFSAPLTYQQAFEKLSPSFGVLTLIGQSPVVANLFYDFESDTEEPGLVFDRSLLTEESEEAGWYVLIFGPEAVHRDDLTIVQAPYPAVIEAVAATRGAGAPAETAEAPADAARLAELEELVERFRRDRDVLASRLAAQQDELETAQSALKNLQSGAGEGAAPAATGDEEAAALREQTAQLEAALDQARERAESAVQDLVTEREAGAELQRKIAELSEQVDQLRGEVAAGNERVSLAEAERDEARQALDAKDADSGQAADTQASQRVAELEQEAARQGKVRQSFETQIRDLLEEVG